MTAHPDSIYYGRKPRCCRHGATGHAQKQPATIKFVFLPPLSRPKAKRYYCPVENGGWCSTSAICALAEPFWSDQIDWIECVPAQAGGGGELWTEWLSLSATYNVKVPVCYNGVYYRRFGGLEKMEEWKPTMKKPWPAASLTPIDALIITRWASDLFSCGESYLVPCRGQSPEYMRQDFGPPPIGRATVLCGSRSDDRSSILCDRPWRCLPVGNTSCPML